jgi:hypothetical protein
MSINENQFDEDLKKLLDAVDEFQTKHDVIYVSVTHNNIIRVAYSSPFSCRKIAPIR